MRSQDWMALRLLTAISMMLAAAFSDAAAAVLPAAPIARATSEHEGGYGAGNAIDGSKETRWASASGGVQSLEFDFGAAATFGKVRIRWERAHASDYSIQTSADGEAWATAVERRGSRGGDEVIDCGGAVGRFMRVLCERPAQFGIYSIWEVEPLDKSAAEMMNGARAAVAARRRAEAIATVRAAMAKRGASEIVFAMRKPSPDGHWYANFGYYAECEKGKEVHVAAPDAEKAVAYREGGRLCKLDVASGKVTVLLDDPRGGVRDPFIDHDGRTVLFSYRPGGGEHYHLHTIGVDGKGLRRLTDGGYDDIEPCRLPDGDILFVSSRCKRWVNCWATQVAVLHRCAPDGGGIRAISSNNEHDNTPWVLPDGRVIYTRWEYIDRSQVDYHHLWTTNPDGTGQMVHFGNQRPGLVMIDAKPVPGSEKVVAIFSPGHGRRDHAGALALVDPRAGPDDTARVQNIATGDDFRDPWAFDERCVIAAKGGAIVAVHGDGRAGEIFALSEEDLKAGYMLHEPRPIFSRATEKRIVTRTDPARDTGTLIVADVYRGRNMSGVGRGDIKELLILESLPKPINYTGGMEPLTYGGSFTLERVLGTVPVEADGSANFKVPALRSLILVALDGQGLAVKRMQSFLTVQPGETTSCIGCHEQRTQTVLRDGRLLALAGPPAEIKPIADCPDVFDYPRDIQPVVDRLCGDCHGYERTARGGPLTGGVNLSGDRGPMFSHSYFTMTTRALFSDGRNKPQSNYGPRELGSAASRILTMIDGSHNGVVASERDRRLLRLWIDSGAAYIGTYAALGTGMIGGYSLNQPRDTDFEWPTTVAAAEVLDGRCASCHVPSGEMALPRALSDERKMSFWRFDQRDPRHRGSRHIVFNLSRPEKSLLALAPLARDAGGLGMCKKADGAPANVFANTADAGYGKIIAMVNEGKRYLEGITRFDMANFRPRPEYYREMRRYGVLPANFDAGSQADVYDIDRRYWESLWYRPE